MAKTRVVVVDDSALVRSLLTEIVNRQSDMECIGSAADPFAAREMIRNLNPDVITLDVEMPRMDGLDFLARLMRDQLKLSIACALAFAVALVALPLLNYFRPEMMAQRVFGFTLTWLILGVLFFPFVWIISYVFIRRSIALEEAEAEAAKDGSRS